MTSPLARWIDAQARSRPRAPALITPSRTLFYADLRDRLRGVAPAPSRVLAVEGAQEDIAFLVLAAPWLGAAVMPLDPRLPDRQVLLAKAGLSEIVAAGRWPWGRIGPVRLTADDIHVIVATSGSTGAPKGVMLSGKNIEAAVLASRKRLPLAPGDLWLACLPMLHIGGVSILHRCVEAGATALVHEGFDERKVWDDIRYGNVTHVSLVPSMLARLLDVAGPPPLGLRHVLIGGAALSEALAERALAAGWPIAVSYGMSETGSQAATLPELPRGWRLGEVGHPLDGFAVRPVEEVKGIARFCVKGPAVMAGYLNPELLPGDGLDDGWFLTNDLGRIEDDGSLTVLGRADDVIVTSGEKVHPLVVEAVLGRLEGIAEVAAVGRPDAVWGEVVVAVVAGNVPPDEVQAYANSHLSGPYRPREIRRIDALPRNAMGKIDRPALKKWIKDR